jgi:hypothetical protein
MEVLRNGIRDYMGFHFVGSSGEWVKVGVSFPQILHYQIRPEGAHHFHIRYSTPSIASFIEARRQIF